MLSLIISILLSLGISANVVDGKIKVNQSVKNQLTSSAEVNNLGGQVVLDQIVVGDEVDPNQ